MNQMHEVPPVLRALRLLRVRCRFADRRLADLPGTLRAELERLGDRIRPGMRIAVAAGSRGIRDIRAIVAGTVSFLKAQGAMPFVVPAMGSHGGATAEGQAGLLAEYGITESGVGAPVRSSMEVVQLPAGECACPVYMDRLAWESDGVVLVNRVKLHTDYRGTYESGLVKMAVIGLGKHAQALAIHRLGVPGLRDVMPKAARAVFATGSILAGVAVVEDAYDNTMAIRALPAEQIMDEEPGLLRLAAGNMARLPLERIDVLVVDRIGKDISGVGMDPNVIGRMAIRGEPEFDSPRIGAIVARDLTAASHGNALGVGLADVITRRLYGKIDCAAMYENVFTSTFLERAKVPVVADTDAEALAYALRAAWVTDSESARIVRIADTAHLSTLYMSPAAVAGVAEAGVLEQSADSTPLLDSAGNMPDVTW